MHAMAKLAGAVTLSAIVAAAPAIAQGKHDRAKMAMAAAQAKITSAGNLGVQGEAPHLLVEAQAALRSAHEDLSAGHKEASIRDANHASELADQAMAKAHAEHEANVMARQQDANAAISDAQQQAADAHASAVAANARANAAEQSARAAQAQAAAAQEQASLQPAAATTVTTSTTSNGTSSTTVHHPVKHRRVVHHYAHHTVVHHPATTTTTTTVSTGH